MDISLLLINLAFKAKKYIFIYENWLIVTIVYNSSQVGNRMVVLVIEGRVEGFDLEKQLKVKNRWSCNKWREWKKHGFREKHVLFPA